MEIPRTSEEYRDRAQLHFRWFMVCVVVFLTFAVAGIFTFFFIGRVWAWPAFAFSSVGLIFAMLEYFEYRINNDTADDLEAFD